MDTIKNLEASICSERQSSLPVHTRMHHHIEINKSSHTGLSGETPASNNKATRI